MYFSVFLGGGDRVTVGLSEQRSFFISSWMVRCGIVIGTCGVYFEVIWDSSKRKFLRLEVAVVYSCIPS